MPIERFDTNTPKELQERVFKIIRNTFKQNNLSGKMRAIDKLKIVIEAMSNRGIAIEETNHIPNYLGESPYKSYKIALKSQNVYPHITYDALYIYFEANDVDLYLGYESTDEIIFALTELNKQADSIAVLAHNQCSTFRQLINSAPSTRYEDLICTLNNKGFATQEIAREQAKKYLTENTVYRTLHIASFETFDLGIYNDDNYTTLFWGTINNSIEIVENTPEAIICQLIAIDKQLPQIMESCQAGIVLDKKKQKTKEIAISTIESVVKMQLSGSNLLYKLTTNDEQATLSIHINHKAILEIDISYNNFMPALSKIKTTIEKLNSIMDELGQPIRIQSYR